MRINSGKDDPAGLIASELLKSQITGTNAAIKNTQRANSLIATADSSMSSITSLLNDIKGLTVEAASTGTMTAEQIAANQMQVNASIESIDRIARTTSYGGKKVLDGSLDFRTSGASGNLTNLQINSANFGTASAVGVNVNVQAAADYARLIYNGTGVDTKTTFDITGNTGTATVALGAGASNLEIADSINRYTDSTGVLAYVEGLASRGTLTLATAGSNNDIVITANAEGSDAGNYTFKVVAGDQEGVRIASAATASSPGVVEVMLKQSYHKVYENAGGILDVDITGTAANTASGVTIKKGATTTAVYHTLDTGVTASTKDGSKTVTIGAGAAPGVNTVAATDASKLNGWTFKVVAAGTYNGTAITNQQATYDEDAKIAYIGNDADALGTLGIAISHITGNSVASTVTTAAITGGALVVGDEFTLGGGGAAGELELTYKEGDTVNDLLAAANKANANVAASLSKGVNGAALVKDLLTGNSRMFTAAAAANAMTASRTTSTASASHVVDLINSALGDKFTAALLRGDSGNGLVGFMDGAVDYGSVNLDNAIRFNGMDSGPIVRLVTTDANGKAIANQQLSAVLINPTEDDIKNGITTPVFQINLATDSAGNSITTAKDIVALLNRMTPQQTGGISASLILPDGVDPNGRTWVNDGCGNIIEVDAACDPDYGNGIVQPTGLPGPCGINQSDLVILGKNQVLSTAAPAVARIGTVSDLNGDPVVPRAAAALATAGNTITTASNNSGLAGVTIAFTTDDNRAGFDEATGVLMVYASPETQAITSAVGLGTALTAAVNGSIAQNWQGIRQFNGATGYATTVAVATTETTYADAVAALDNSGQYPAGYPVGMHFAGNTEALSATVGNIRGINTTDPALKITALQSGVDMAGVKIILEDDNTLPAFAPGVANTDGNRVKVAFDATTGVLTIKANGASGVSARALADTLNNNDVFKGLFSAEATYDVVNGNATSNPANTYTDTLYGTVYFGSSVTPAAEFTGGYRIQTAEKASGAGNIYETSSGLGMLSANDDNQRLVIESAELGSGQFVNIYVAEGQFNTLDEYGNKVSYDTGSDMIATVNGMRANAQGNNISIDTANLSLSMTVGNYTGWSGFSIDGGGALFQLGPDVVSTQQIRLGIASMLSTKLGGTSGKLYELKTGGAADLTFSDASRKLADKIVNEAISSVSNTRGRLGAVQKATLEPNLTYLQDSLLALSEANQLIAEADFAEESSNLTRLQLLMQAGSQALALAGQMPQYAAQLVR
jgi:flagellin-like hook-associated protein FlgL